MKTKDILAGWGKVLCGKPPLLSIEITRECPLHCPGCYAFGESHLGEGMTLKSLTDLRGDALVDVILSLVKKHDPRHVSLVGGEPLMRRRELSHVLPVLSRRGTLAMVVTSGVIPIPVEWNDLPGTTVAVSVDGLPAEHNARRAPATYERILRNISGRKVNIHCTIVRQQAEEAGYLDRFLAFWSERPEVGRIWFSVYTPQRGEISAEMLTADQRIRLAEELVRLRRKYRKLMLSDGMARAFVTPPQNPRECLFSKMSVNYTADFRTQVEPCVFGGDPDCAQCGCAISAGLHWVGGMRLIGPLRGRHLALASIGLGARISKFARTSPVRRWKEAARAAQASESAGKRAHDHNSLVQIESSARGE